MRSNLLSVYIFVFILSKTLLCFPINEEGIRRVRVVEEATGIFIPTILAGMGHIRAFQAIEKALMRIFGDVVEVKAVDPLASISPKIPELINQLYLWAIKSPLRALWGAIYESGLISGPESPLGGVISQIYARILQNILKDFIPEVMVSTHPLITAGATLLKREGLAEFPLVSVATDFDIHPLGISKEVDIFVISDESLSRPLREAGIPEEKIKVLGIPIDPKFGKELSKSELKEKLGLEQELPTILILGGGFGVGPIEEIVSSFKYFGKPLQLIVVAGKNESLKQRIEEIREDLEIKVEVFGYVENMEELMGASDLVITKPGGITIAEALAKKLPLVLIGPIGVQEEKNLEFVVRGGAGVYVKQVEEILRIVNELLADPVKLESMRAQAERLAHPNSGIEIARLLLKIVEEKKKK